MSAEQTQTNNATPPYATLVCNEGLVYHFQTAADFARYLLGQRSPNRYGVSHVEDDKYAIHACVWWHEQGHEVYESVAEVESEGELSKDEILTLWVENVADRENSYGLGDLVRIIVNTRAGDRDPATDYNPMR